MQDLAPLNLAAVDIMHVLPLAVAFVLGMVARMAAPATADRLSRRGVRARWPRHAEHRDAADIADLGVTLLLFTIGLKLHVKDLIAPVVWLTASVHMLVITVLAMILIKGLAILGLGMISDLSLTSALLDRVCAEFFQHGLRGQGLRGAW